MPVKMETTLQAMKSGNWLPVSMLPAMIPRNIGTHTGYLTKCILAISLLLLQVLCEAADHEHTVSTLYGKVLGFRKRVRDGNHQHHHSTAFLGMPYAIPPKRYEPSEPMKPWGGTLNATYFGSACYQGYDGVWPGFSGSEQWNPNVEVSEDCLYLNVWTPSPRVSHKMPVMVWIFGGGFYSGCASLQLYDGAYLAATQGVVVVSMNYRVGSFGFLSFGGPESPGNMGLLDQVLALQWVQDNIEFFGGDPDTVTLFGESAGAVSVGLHILSPVSSSLFTRVIFQSGSPVTPWAIITPDEANQRAMMFAKKLECAQNENGYNNTITEMLACLRTRNAGDILVHEFVVSGTYIFPWNPVVDGTFLTETPQSSLERYAVKTTDILLGVNRNEGSSFMVYSLEGLGFDKDTDAPINKTLYHKTIEETMGHLNEFGRSAIAFQYNDWVRPDDPYSLRDASEAFVADYNIVCPSHELAKAYVGAENKVYMYKFNQRASNQPWGEWMGVMHGDEIAFVFGQPLNVTNGFNNRERILSKKIMRLWANFAKTGNPNTDSPNAPNPMAEGWPEFKEETGQLTYVLDTESIETPTVVPWPWAKRCAFWNEYLPKLNTQTGNINEAERVWKEQFHMWSTKYMVDWKAEFNHYVYNRDQECSDSASTTTSNDTQ